MEFSSVWKNNFGLGFRVPLLLLFKAPRAPFWPPSGRNLAKRGLAGPFWTLMIFLAAGPLFGP